MGRVGLETARARRRLAVEVGTRPGAGALHREERGGAGDRDVRSGGCDHRPVEDVGEDLAA